MVLKCLSCVLNLKLPKAITLFGLVKSVDQVICQNLITSPSTAKNGRVLGLVDAIVRIQISYIFSGTVDSALGLAVLRS